MFYPSSDHIYSYTYIYSPNAYLFTSSKILCSPNLPTHHPPETLEDIRNFFSMTQEEARFSQPSSNSSSPIPSTFKVTTDIHPPHIPLPLFPLLHPYTSHPLLHLHQPHFLPHYPFSSLPDTRMNPFCYNNILPQIHLVVTCSRDLSRPATT